MRKPVASSHIQSENYSGILFVFSLSLLEQFNGREPRSLWW